MKNPQRPPVSVRYTEAEEREARRRAAAAGLTLNGYIRARTAPMDKDRPRKVAKEGKK